MGDDHEHYEDDLLMPEYNGAANESSNLNELGFPWLLISAIKESYELVRSKTIFSRQLLFSFQSHLVIVFIICILSFVFGSIFLNGCSRERMLGIVFIVQGSCGLFVVFVHIWKLASGWTTTDMAQISFKKRRAIWYLIGFTHLISIFCIVWFFVGHIWLVPEIVGHHYTCKRMLHRFTQIMVLMQYTVGTWFIFCHIWSSPCALRWLEKKIQVRLTQISTANVHVKQDNMIENRDIVYASTNQNDSLNNI